MRGLFISVEGIDGAGKSTHVEFIKQVLQDNGFKVVVTREPGGTPLGESVRNILLHNHTDIHRITELFLMFASRQELIDKVIEPNLKAGICVIADRFVDASVAYQAYGRKIGQEKVEKVISLLDPRLTTDLTLLFDVPLSLALERLSKNESRDRIEQEGTNFFAAVQAAYHKIAIDEPERVKVINTNQDIKITQTHISEHLKQLIKRKVQ